MFRQQANGTRLKALALFTLALGALLTGAQSQMRLYVTNAAFPFFPGPNPRRPSLMRLEVGVPGQPRP